MDRSETKKHYIIGAVVALIGSAGFMYVVCTSCRTDFDRFAWNTAFSFFCWLALWTVNNELNHFLDGRMSWIQTPVKRLLTGVALTIGCTVLAVFLLMKSWELIWGFRFDTYRPVIVNALLITCIISLFFHGRSFLFQWKQAAVDAEHFKQQSIKAQYESLKNQVNPHFLFNSFNALTNLVYDDPDKAVKFIKQLSEVYRYVLDTRDKEIIPLQEEIKFIESYLFLQQIRFGDKLKVDMKLDDKLVQVAPLSLQMLIENAIKHNVVSQDDPLLIKIYDEGDFIVVENNLQRKRVLEEASSGLGLENIRKRYEFLSDKKVEVIEDEKVFKVKIPRLI